MKRNANEQRVLNEEVQLAGKTVRAMLPGDAVYALLVFNLGQGDDGFMCYVSNGKRETMLAALKECVVDLERDGAEAGP